MRCGSIPRFAGAKLHLIFLTSKLLCCFFFDFMINIPITNTYANRLPVAADMETLHLSQISVMLAPLLDKP